MKNLTKKITDDFHVPEEFLRTYRLHIILKCLLFAVIIAASLIVSLLLSRYSGKSRLITIMLIMSISVYVSGFSMDMNLLLRKTYLGRIDSIELKQGPRKTSKWDDIYFVDTMVHLYVIPEGKSDVKEIILGNCKDSSYSRKLRAAGLNESFEGSFEKNPFYEKMPYQPGDTLLFLRGLKYPLRISADKTDDSQYVVCPYCGDCFKITQNNCPRCHKTLIYGK